MTQRGSPGWLHNAVGYEVYIRSFSDGDGDGVGDLSGLHDRLDYLAWLGVDLVWTTPFFPSPMADHGYDVADYLSIDPCFGDLDDFDRVLERAHSLGLRMAVDIVPNHTSSEHPWFRAALEDPDGACRDYYLWRDPAPDGGPPNNWVSHFGGPAWTLDPRSGQYYCHLFLAEQPDLNWRNPAVRSEFERILEFWLGRGADAVRIDVAHALVKDEQLRDNPMTADPSGLVNPRERFRCFEHVHDLGQRETAEIYRSWRSIAERHDAALIGETYVLDADALARLVTPDGLHVGFWFAPMSMPWGAHSVRAVLEAAHQAIGSQVGWVQSSHDESRPVSRFGGGELGRRRSLGLCLMLMGLPGTPFVYQGEELGLADAVIPAELRHDPIARLNEGEPGRDVCRSPMPWAPGPNLGFSGAASTWLPQAYEAHETVEAQRADPDSHLHAVRALLELRRGFAGLPAEVEFLDDLPAGVVGYRRGSHMFLLNAGSSMVTLADGALRIAETAVDPAAFGAIDLTGLRVLHRTAAEHCPTDECPTGHCPSDLSGSPAPLAPGEALAAVEALAAGGPVVAE